MLIRLCFLLFTLICFICAEKDYYKILDIDRSASSRDIKKAYKKLSRRWHPDKNKGSQEAYDKFLDVSTAYETLIDPEKKTIYDTYGEDGLKNRGGGRGSDFHNPFDMFAQFFGGGGYSNAQKKGPSIHSEIEVDLRDIYLGRTIEFQIAKQTICDECEGSGAKSHEHITDCDECGGRGVKVVRQMLGPGMYQTVQRTCEKCNGRRKIIKEKCPICKGEKVRRGSTQLALDIPPGAPEGHSIVFENEGDEDPEWIPGDLIFSVKSKMHPIFIRKGNHLYTKHVIGLDDAILGFSFNLTHLDGHIVTLTRKDVTQSGTVDTILNEGMIYLTGGGEKHFGNLYVEYNVVLPMDIDDKFKRRISKLFGRQQDNLNATKGKVGSSKGDHEEL